MHLQYIHADTTIRREQLWLRPGAKLRRQDEAIPDLELFFSCPKAPAASGPGDSFDLILEQLQWNQRPSAVIRTLRLIQSSVERLLSLSNHSELTSTKCP